MRFLIDTNVFILGESNGIVQSDVAELVSFALKHNVKIMIHSASLEDIWRDSNIHRRQIHESKFGKYPILDDPDKPNETFKSKVGSPSRPQDFVDHNILYSVYKNAVDFLITEDLGMHRKARKLGLGDRILTVSQAVQYLRKRFEKYVPPHLCLEHLEIHRLDLQSGFFDDFREDYSGFDEWFVRKSREGRKCWCWRDNKGNLKALLIYAEKIKPILRNFPENVLKICTFKVANEARGLKLGELLLRICFDYCSMNNISALYLTVFEKHTYLRMLLEEFGFFTLGETKTTELIYVKDFVPPKELVGMHPLEYCRKFFPKFYDGEKVRKFVVPIRPEFHDRLFPDVHRRQTSLSEFDLQAIELNTIKKAYVCNSRIGKILQGDILLFYRSKVEQGITGIGIVESTLRNPSSLESLITFIGPRSVYSRSDLRKFYVKGALAILFRYVGQLPEYLSRKKLLELKTLTSAPQSIVTMKNTSYNRIKESAEKWLV